jgi:hypothetical protein
VRESQIGVVVRTDIACFLGEWLIQKANGAASGIIEGSEGHARKYPKARREVFF